MDLRLSEREQSVVAEARAGFATGAPPSPSGRTVTELVLMGMACGRAAFPVGWHAAVLATLLSHPRPEETAAGVAAPGERTAVVHGPPGAPVILVVGTTGGMLARDRAELELTAGPTIDDPEAEQVHIGPARDGWAATNGDGAVLRAGLVRAADAVGAAEAALESTIAYLPGRQLYGAPLSDRQVVRHRVADMAMDVAVIRDAVLDAAGACDRGAGEAEVSVAIAAARASVARRAPRVTSAAHQLGGGAGILAARPLHLWFRRARGAALEPGDARDQLATVAASLLGK